VFSISRNKVNDPTSLPPGLIHTSLDRFSIVLHVKRSILPLDVFVSKQALQWKLYYVSVTLEHYTILVHITLLICSALQKIVLCACICLEFCISIVLHIWRGGIHRNRLILFSLGIHFGCAPNGPYFHARTKIVSYPWTSKACLFYYFGVPLP
jgi:hypothetical protein